MARKCERCGGRQTIGDCLCDACGGAGYDDTPAPDPVTLDEKALNIAAEQGHEWICRRDNVKVSGCDLGYLRTVISAYLAALPREASAEPNTMSVPLCRKCGSSMPGVHWEPCPPASAEPVVRRTGGVVEIAERATAQDILRAASAEPWPEVREEDVRVLRLGLCDVPCPHADCDRTRRILRVLEHAKGASDDTRRLDWLEAEHRRFDPVAALNVKYKLDRQGSEWVNVASPVRDAIDAARSTDAERTHGETR